MTKTNRTPRHHSVFVVRASAAMMPAKCWGRYQHVGVVEMWDGSTSCAQLRNTRSQAIRWYRGKLFSGSSGRCAAALACVIAMGVARTLTRQYAADMAAGYVEHLAEREDEI
jgi:hypothetical protein